MLKSIFSVAFLSLSIIAVSQTKNINFEHSTFAEIKAKAKKENKERTEKVKEDKKDVKKKEGISKAK